jgi:tetratricopeptide (TPR) repeat protein
LFHSYFAFSPSLDWDDRLPARSLKGSLEAARTLKAFLYVSREDDSGQALADYEGLVAALASRAVPGFRWKSEVFPEERHTTTPLLGQIHALRALALFKRNVDASSNSANAWDGLADAYSKAGRLREAASASDRSVELATKFENPNTPYFQHQAKKANERLRQESVAPR